tara:strand:- start:7192 stop:7650 length:459 start_codon:yes stop_codon:yes gene_type:complete
VVKTTPINIRKAVEEDVLDCLILFKQFHKESKLPYSWDAKKTQEAIISSFPIDNYEILVAEQGEEIVGLLACMYSQPLFSSESISTEIAWYVNKDHRNSTAGFRLMKAYEEWAVGKGVKYVGMTYLENITDLSEIYEKKGYLKAETQYMKEF